MLPSGASAGPLFAFTRPLVRSTRQLVKEMRAPGSEKNKPKCLNPTEFRKTCK